MARLQSDKEFTVDRAAARRLAPDPAEVEVGDVEPAVAVEGQPGRDAAGVVELGDVAGRVEAVDRAGQPVDEEEVAVPIEGGSLR